MKISCQSCQAKYTIADEKVLGKIVKIRCKKCGATIVINGNEPEAAAGGAPAGAASDPGYGADQDQWTVNVADGDQRTMTPAEIVEEYKSGTIHDETFCWKDGMNDWLPLREIESLYAVCAGSSGQGQDYPPLSLHGAEDSAGRLPDVGARGDAAAAAVGGLGAGFGGSEGLFGGSSASSGSRGGLAASGGGYHAETNGNGGAGLFEPNHVAPRSTSGLGGGGSAGLSASSASAAAAASSAARRTGGRGNQADLFGSVAQAGSEEDVMTSAAPVSSDGSKLTGQRNENSVLFSLGALTSKGPDDKPVPPPPAGDGSGLIDIRALASSTSGDGESSSAKSSRHVDDIMNLGGGGAFSAALAAPVLAPPSHDLSDLSPISAGGSQNRTLYLAIIVGCLLIGAAMIIAVLLLRPSVKDDPKANEAPITPSSVASAATPPPAPPTPSAEASSAAGSGAKEITPGAGTKGSGQKWTGKAGTGTGSGATGASGSGDESTPAATPAPAEKPKSLADAMNSAVGKSKEEPVAAAPTGGTAPFDRGAAAAALGNVNITSCKKGDGPTGAGHVKVTFQPSGTVSTVEVDQPPFSGTPVGGCIAAKFRSAHVPPFAGAPVTVGKGFSLN